MTDRVYTIQLHGRLKELFPEPFTLSARNIAEAFNGFCKQTKALNPLPGQEKHEIAIAGVTSEHQLHDENFEITELHVFPAMYGGGRGGFFRIILGIALIALAIANPAFLGVIGISTTALFFTGASMLLGGLLSMFSAAPEGDRSNISMGNNTSNPEASKYLGAPRNTTRLGTRIPILYGEFRVYGHYLTFNVDAKDVAT